MDNSYKVYVLTDENSNIIGVNSSVFLADTTGWTQIDEGTGDRYHHAQGNYFDKPLVTNEGIYRYKLIGGRAVEKTEAEIAAEIEALPPPPPSDSEVLAALIATLAEKGIVP